ncbi:MAG TPA: MBL fold metallo-hydrolase [Thermoplasmata archaeon]|nr:MBL fold metallo-hydrolase [Thermoplasmata archaeon]
MAEILPGVHLVDTIAPESTHVFLLKDKGASWTLIDTGVPGNDAAVLKYLAQQHVEPSAVKKILLTHLHLDHTGNLGKLQKATRARTFAHWVEAAYIAKKPAYEGPGMAPVEPVTIDEPFKDGDTIDAAGGLIAYHTPGHTPGHTAYYQAERRLLFSGDLFFSVDKGLILTIPQYTFHTPTATISARRMAQLSIESLLVNHGSPLLKGAGEKVRALASSL